MNGFFILQSDYSQHTSLKIVHHAPESETIIFLRLCLEGIFDDLDTPFFFEIRSLPQHLIFEIFGKLVNIHNLILYSFFLFVHSRNKRFPTKNHFSL